ncbi:hypothetical protein RJZ57_008393, partial [Blastomyces gilchristii]
MEEDLAMSAAPSGPLTTGNFGTASALKLVTARNIANMIRGWAIASLDARIQRAPSQGQRHLERQLGVI